MSGQHHLLNVAVVGGFLDGQVFDLASQLNCLIGARGTGKTTVLELIRFGMDAMPANPKDRERIENLVARNLKGGRVDLTVRTKDGLVYTVSRAPGEDPIVKTQDGRVTDISIRAGGLFRVDVFSQNEVEAIADRPTSQLDLLDAFEAPAIAHKEQETAFQTLLEHHKEAQEKATERSRLERARNELLAKARELERVQGQVVALGDERRKLMDRLTELRDQRYALRKAIADRINGLVGPAIRVQVDQCGDQEAAALALGDDENQVAALLARLGSCDFLARICPRGMTDSPTWAWRRGTPFILPHD